jgi:uncharacterized repeat protein (TIGR03803 family)
VKRYPACLKIGAYCGLAWVLTACDDYNSAPIYISTDGATPTALIQASDGNFYGTTADGGQYATGTVFKLTATGAETVLYSFGASPTDGLTPMSLIEGSDGNFYGVTSAGGTGLCQFGCGTVFKVTPGGVETVLYSFGGGADGGQPNALIQGTDGNLYGTTSFGGAMSLACPPGGCGVAFRLTTAGVETVLYSFAAASSSDGTVPASLIEGTDGNFYGLTSQGGTANGGTVFKLTPAGAETVLHSFAGGSDGATPEASMVQGSDGNFYGTTEFGGGSSACTKGCGVAFSITPAGVETVLHAFAGGTADGANPETAMIQASDGNFYSTTDTGGIADTTNCSGGCGTVFKMTPAGATPPGATSLLYSFTATAGAGQPNPSSLLQGKDGNFYGTAQSTGQFGFGSVFKLTAGGTATVLYSFGANSYP